MLTMTEPRPTYAPKVVLVHEITPDLWYLSYDGYRAPVSPVCTSLEQLRWALAQFCLAVNGPAVEVQS